jgi:outer membrane protein TolC
VIRFLRLSRFLVTVSIAGLVTLVGCTSPDRMEIFRTGTLTRAEEEPSEPVPVPEELRARPEPPIGLDLPAEGEPIPLSVEQAVVLALHNNRDLEIQQLDPVLTGTFERIERGEYDPELFADLQYGEERTSETSRSTEEQFDVKGKDWRGVAGIRQEIPTGTEIEGSVRHTRTISSRTPELQQARLGLTITQSLLQGFGPAVNLASVRQAELDTLASRYELRGFTEAVVAETEIAYWRYVLAKREIAIFESSLEIARQQRDEIEQRIEVGLLPDTEVAAARAEVARRELALIVARALLEERRLRLVRLLDPERDGSLDREVVALTGPEIAPAPIEDIDDRLELADKSRPDLNEARVRLRRDNLEVVVTRNGILPRLDFFVDLGLTGFGDTFTESFREIGDDTYDWTVGLSLTHSLGNRAAEARDEAARASRWQAREAVENLRQLVRLDVRLAINDVERLREQIAATEVTRILQEQTLRAEQERFDVGASTALLVASAQRDLLVSQIAEVESIVNYRIALVNLHLAEGSLLERRGIVMR